MRLFWVLALCGVLVVETAAAAGGGGSRSTPALVLGVHPYLPATELVERFTPLAHHLGVALGRPARVQVARDYTEHISRTAANRYDVSYLGPASFVRLLHEHGPKPVLARIEICGRDVFRGAVVVDSDSPLHAVRDLVGTRVAFGDPHSTMGHYLPRHLLLRHGVALGDLKRHVFLGNHRDVALGVLLGEFDAGAVKEEVFRDYEERGLRLLAWTEEVPEHLFVASDALSTTELAALRDALLGPRQSEEALRRAAGIRTGLSGFAAAAAEDYRALGQVLHSLAPAGAGR